MKKVLFGFIAGVGIGALAVFYFLSSISDGQQRRICPLTEGVFYSLNPDWHRIRVEIKKGYSEGEFIVEETGSNGAIEPRDASEYVVRQKPNQENLEIIKAYEYTYTPTGDGKETRVGDEMHPMRQQLMSLIVKGDLLLVNGCAYALESDRHKGGSAME